MTTVPVDGIDDTRERRAIVIAMLFAIALDQASAPALAPAIGSVAGAFHLDARATAWLDMAFEIGYLASIFVSVWGIARFGKRRYLSASLFGYAVFSLACALASTPALFLAARFGAGASLGGLFTSALLTIVGAAPKRDLPLAMTIFSAVMLLAPTAAPLYAGAIVEHATWRVAFGGASIAAFLGAIAAYAGMRDVAEASARRFDVTTFGALVFALASFQFLATQGAAVHWFATPAAAFAVFGMAVAVAVIARRESRSSRSPFLDVRAVAAGATVRGLLVGVILGILLGGVSIEAQFVRGAFSLGPTATGAAIAVRCFGVACGVVAATALDRRRIDAWIVMAAGLIVVAGTYLTMAVAVRISASLAVHVVAGIFQAFGFALILGPLAVTLFGSVDRTSFGSLAVFFKIAVLLGGAAGLALASTLLDAFANAGNRMAFADVWIGAAGLAAGTIALVATLRPDAAVARRAV